jgi:hypothetical protein
LVAFLADLAGGNLDSHRKPITRLTLRQEMLNRLVILKHAVTGVFQTVKRTHIALSSKYAPCVAMAVAASEESWYFHYY